MYRSLDVKYMYRMYDIMWLWIIDNTLAKIHLLKGKFKNECGKRTSSSSRDPVADYLLYKGGLGSLGVMNVISHRIPSIQLFEWKRANIAREFCWELAV